MSNRRHILASVWFGMLLTLLAACTRSPAPPRAAVALPAVNVVSAVPAAGQDERELLGDEQFRPATTTPESQRTFDAPRANAQLAIPVISRLTAPNGETKIRLVGVVAPSALGTLLNRNGDLKARLIEVNGIELLAVEQQSLTISNLDAKEVLDATEILQQSGASLMHPTPLAHPTSHNAGATTTNSSVPQVPGAELQHPNNASFPQLPAATPDRSVNGSP